MARVWDTFSIQPGTSDGGNRPIHDNHQNPRKLQSNLNISQIHTKPILYYNLQYHLQGWKYDAAKQKMNHQYDAFARVY